MHEAAIANSILQIAGERAARYDGACVDIIKVRVGSFRNVDPESLDFAFNALRETVAGCREAKLCLQVVPAVAICQGLRHTYRPAAENGFRCTVCNSAILELLEGEELDLVGCTISMDAQATRREDARIS